ncbi:MAG: c-type cytochrome [Candidatus Sulfotelmatobacter sp.]
MRKTIGFGGIALLLLVPLMLGQKPRPRPRGVSSALIAHGKYLVERVGLCGDCHTPHDDKGEPIQGQWLQGAPIPFKPIVPMPVWAYKSPAIAGLPRWEKEAAIRFFMTGIADSGLPARPPMPQYRFNQPDAEAIVAYLKSLAPGK